MAYPKGTEVPDQEGNNYKSATGHVFVAFYKDGNIESVGGFAPMEKVTLGLVGWAMTQNWLILQL